MADTWTSLPTRSSSDTNAAADINAMAADVRLLKGGVAGMAPTTDVESLKATIAALATVPVGTVIAKASANVPTGYLLCNGQAVSRTIYAALFADIASTYGDGDHSTTFNLPDYQDAFLRGEVGNASSGFTDSTKRAAALGTKQDDGLQHHWHDVHRGDYSGGSNPIAATTAASYNGLPSMDTNILAYATDFRSDGTHGTPRTGYETVVKNMSVYYFIKY